MNTKEHIRFFVKSCYKELIAAVFAFVVIIYFSKHDFLFCLIFFGLSVFKMYSNFYAKTERARELKVKGLTEQDQDNINFVKSWEEMRTGGIWRYAIIEGGIIVGAGIALVICLITIMVVGITKLFAEPSNMFSLLGFAYLAGAAIGFTIYWIIFPKNEKRFKTLTEFSDFKF